MQKQRKVLVVMDVLDEHKEMFKKVSPDVEIKYGLESQMTAQDFETAEMIVGNVRPEKLSGCKNLKLLQLNSAGTDGYTKAEILPEGAVLANATGAYGLAISEHMIGVLLCLMKKIDKYKMNQEKNLWKDEGPVESIYGSKTLVVGFGDIGSEFAVRMNALGSKVSAIRKNLKNKPEYIDELHSMEDFKGCLKKADIVAASFPGTAQTYKVFNKEAFDSMKDGAFFINVGRGTAVDTDALCDAIESGKLAGASVDVTDPEPLPENHRLWKMPNVLITPHISGGYHLKETHNRIVGIACRNLSHLVKGEEFENLVDMESGYRKNF